MYHVYNMHQNDYRQDTNCAITAVSSQIVYSTSVKAITVKLF